MKKTVKNLMTAAVFAAAMGTLPTAETASADYNPQETFATVYGPPVVTTETTTMQAVYGTVPYWTTTPVDDYNPQQTETTFAAVYGPAPFWTTMPTVTTATKETVPAPVYGPPIAWNTTTMPIETEPVETVPVPVYGPPLAWKGDLIADNRIDVFDMIEMRKKYINSVLYGDYDSKADVNSDGEVNIADMVMLQKYILGTAKDFSGQDITVTPTSTTTTTTVVDENNEEN